MSDHNELRYFFDESNLNSKKDRQLAMISEFDFEIRYIKGKDNMVANYLKADTCESYNNYDFLWDKLIGSDLIGRSTG